MIPPQEQWRTRHEILCANAQERRASGGVPPGMCYEEHRGRWMDEPAKIWEEAEIADWKMRNGKAYCPNCHFDLFE